MHVHYGLLLVEINLERDLEKSWMLLYDTCDDVADEKRDIVYQVVAGGCKVQIHLKTLRKFWC